MGQRGQRLTRDRNHRKDPQYRYLVCRPFPIRPYQGLTPSAPFVRDESFPVDGLSKSTVLYPFLALDGSMGDALRIFTFSVIAENTPCLLPPFLLAEGMHVGSCNHTFPFLFSIEW
jgi:hypothetical protein